ncbi:NADH:flavin oxidoreductase/NADH oxidase [Russula brevipes]|nr:NADH:flavin oxidoreductase/NADH oxidase [Russula brevipes]
MAASKLFQPIQFGNVTLQHRVVMAPLTRNRGDNKHTHTDLAVEHYAARASVPGSLIISEATFIAHKASGYTFHAPGIWSEEQIAGWKKVTDAVHAKGSFMYLQLWALGRAASPEQLQREDPSFEYVSPGTIPIPGSSTANNDATRPRALTKAEIAEYVQLYATAARNAVERAGFDGVEIHGANGFLVDQFLKEASNDRVDEYGSSPENRARFALEVAAAVSAAVGEERVGLRLSPWLTNYETERISPVATFSYLVSELRRRHPNFGYLHVVEPRIRGGSDRLDSYVEEESNDFLRDIWTGKPWISAGGFTRDSALKQADERGELVAFGRYYTSNVRSISVILPLFSFLTVLNDLFLDSPIFLSDFRETFH